MSVVFGGRLWTGRPFSAGKSHRSSWIYCLPAVCVGVPRTTPRLADSLIGLAGPGIHGCALGFGRVEGGRRESAEGKGTWGGDQTQASRATSQGSHASFLER